MRLNQVQNYPIHLLDLSSVRASKCAKCCWVILIAGDDGAAGTIRLIVEHWSWRMDTEAVVLQS
jgi:hypothetical protein